MAAMSDAERAAFLAQPVICRLGCLDDDGYPYVIPTWYAYAEGGFYLVPRARAVWAHYLERDGRVSLCIDASETPYRRVIVRGRAEIIEMPNVGGRWMEFGTRMARNYRGEEGLAYIERTKDEPRWLIFVHPERMTSTTGGWAARYKHSQW
jgi:nitroimidazol reductase NimA-like FMN-containing flavoprotein (pyridoxamine 5'-phosphate oxidase superfamily)